MTTMAVSMVLKVSSGSVSVHLHCASPSAGSCVRKITYFRPLHLLVAIFSYRRRGAQFAAYSFQALA